MVCPGGCMIMSRWLLTLFFGVAIGFLSGWIGRNVQANVKILQLEDALRHAWSIRDELERELHHSYVE